MKYAFAKIKEAVGSKRGRLPGRKAFEKVAAQPPCSSPPCLRSPARTTRGREESRSQAEPSGKLQVASLSFVLCTPSDFFLKGVG